MRTREEVVVTCSPESQARIKEMSDEMILEVCLQMNMVDLQRSQPAIVSE